MAGTARMVPATSPLMRSWRTSINCGPSSLQDSDLFEFGLLGSIEADLAVDDVADLGEVARAARPLVVDVLALGDQLEPVHRAVHLDAVALGDLADVVPDRCARRLAPRPGDGEQHEADVIVALARVRVEIGRPQEFREALVARGVHRG